MRSQYVVCFILVILINLSDGKAKRKRFRRPGLHYPKDSVFWATDFFVRGCKTFLEKCPAFYKQQQVCAQSYGGDFKDFPNYCEMQYENCNTWRNWRIYKRERC